MIDFGKPFSSAWSRMELVLFKPFDLGKWFVLGFSAWLASFVHDQAGSLFNGNYNGIGNDHHSSSKSAWLDRSPDHLLASAGDYWQNWLHAATTVGNHASIGQNAMWLTGFTALMTVLVLCVLFLALVLILVMYWIGSRGQFMFLDNILHNRTKVVQPWRQFRQLGNNLFCFQLLVGLLLLLVTLAVVVVCLFGFMYSAFGNLALSSFDHFQFIKHWPGLLGWSLLLILYFIVLCAAVCLFMEFGIPIMYRLNCGATRACVEVWRLFCRNPWSFVIYLLIRLGLGMAFTVLTLFLCCSCCLTILPYLNAVSTLPLRVFRFSFTLHYLAQFGPEYDLWPKLPAPPPVPQV